MTVAAIQTGAVQHPASPAPTYLVIEYAIRDDLRFLSHHDEMRMLARALTRARWPLAYSRGFNPQPRMAIPLPRPVGVASRCQCAIIAVDAPPAGAALFDALATQLPSNCSLLRVITDLGGRKLHARGVEFNVRLAPGAGRVAEQRICDLLAADEVHVDRRFGPSRPARRVNIRPYIESLELRQSHLQMRLTIDGQRTTRPEEILAALQLPAEDHAPLIERTRVEWDVDLTARPHWPPTTERNGIGNEENSQACGEKDNPPQKDHTQDR